MAASSLAFGTVVAAAVFIGNRRLAKSYNYHLEIDTGDEDAVSKLRLLWMLETRSTDQPEIKDNKCILGFCEQEDGIKWLQKCCEICVENGCQIIKADCWKEFVLLTSSEKFEIED